MTASELRQKYFAFFQARGHYLIPSASLIPENDPSVLFTTAGMHPLVPFLLGEKHPGGKRLVSAEKCIRTSDIDEVGDATHHTFFEMLGNWSLGDYFKEEAIKLSFEFLTAKEYLNLDMSRLAVSVFAGDDDAPFDQEAHNIWLSLGIDEKRIARLPKKNNWWGTGQAGPCGPDSEMFYWVGDKKDTPERFNDDHPFWVEIWNDVFMQYRQTETNTYLPLEQKNIDTGMGLERVLAVMNGLADNYQTELWLPLIKKIEKLSGKNYQGNERPMRIIADHIKAAAMIMGDDKGISPSNTDQGYVVRRLIRRAIRYAKQIGIEQKDWTKELVREIIIIYQNVYHELERNQTFIYNNLSEEEEKFSKTLINGEKKISGEKIDGDFAFNLFQTYGYPVEMTKEIAAERGIKLSNDFETEYSVALEKHQNLSRTSSAGKFKGGLVDSSEETVKLHTAAHLLLAALRKVLGDQVTQKGSNITAERLRFDFSHSDKMTEDQKTRVEMLVNEAIEKDFPVVMKEMTLSEAKAEGAMGVFESKYGEMVKVYEIGDFSHEICGGPHVEHTGLLGHFKISKEESSSAGVRRIKAVLDN
jgi:alanyl-tRNA synthetase